MRSHEGSLVDQNSTQNFDLSEHDELSRFNDASAGCSNDAPKENILQDSDLLEPDQLSESYDASYNSSNENMSSCDEDIDSD